MATNINRKMVPCFCRTWEFGEFDGNNEQAESYDTGCNETTTRTFAMGHDAKLAGYLVRAELAGEEIRNTVGGVATHYGSATGAALSVSQAFAAKVRAQLDAAKARLAKKAAKETAKAARKSAKEAERATEAVVELAPIEAMIKVGRWTYPAQIDRNTREATYQGKLGGTKTVAEGKYTVL
jgi:hypothetical protein